MTDTTDMTDEPKARRGVNIAPSSMVEESIAEWPLHRVVDFLRRREKEEKPVLQSVRLHCRSTIKSLVDIIDSLVIEYHVQQRSKMCRWLSYHAVMIARDDAVVSRLAAAQTILRNACLVEDDTDTLDIMHSLTPYSPRFVDESDAGLSLYDTWVASDFEEYARVCGVHRYRITQVYIVKSILSGDTGRFGETAMRLRREVERWDTWMDFRLGATENLVKRKTELTTNPQCGSV